MALPKTWQSRVRACARLLPQAVLPQARELLLEEGTRAMAELGASCTPGELEALVDELLSETELASRLDRHAEALRGRGT